MKPAKSAAKPATTTSAHPSSRELATYMPLVYQVVARFLRKLPPNVLRDDLVAAGSIGLVDALRKSEERGAAFEWYARVRVRGAIVDELRTQDWLSRRARSRASAEFDAVPPQSGVFRAAVVSFEDMPGEESGGSFADEEALSPLELVEQRFEAKVLAGAVDTLPERERDIVRSYYFDGVPFKAIAERLGVSEPRVSQLHTRAMQMLKTTMSPKKDEAAA